MLAPLTPNTYRASQPASVSTTASASFMPEHLSASR
jgi:hypothetical protein